MFHIFRSECGRLSIMLDIGTTASTFVSGIASLVLWMRIALAYAVRHIWPASAGCEHVDSQEAGAAALVLASDISLDTVQQNATQSVNFSSVASSNAPQPPTVSVQRHEAAIPRFTRFVRSGYCFALVFTGIMFSWLFWMVGTYGTYETYAAEVDSKWGYLVNSDIDASPSQVAPIWLGEFGTDADDLYWKYLLRYVRERDIDFGYWSLNGQKGAIDVVLPEPYGLLLQDSVTIRDPWKLEDLQALMNVSSLSKIETV